VLAVCIFPLKLRNGRRFGADGLGCLITAGIYFILAIFFRSRKIDVKRGSAVIADGGADPGFVGGYRAMLDFLCNEHRL
jgi:hypothetical protein